jgi:flagellar biosynthesis protein FlhF
MRIKQFKAKNMTTALRLIKDELGSDAVILSAKSLRQGKGFFGSLKYAGVEVTAAIDNQGVQRIRSENVRLGNSDLNGDALRLKDRYRSARESGQPITSEEIEQKNRFKPLAILQGPTDEKHKILSSLYYKLLAQDVDREVASNIIDEIKEKQIASWNLSKKTIKSNLKSIFYEMGVRIDRTGLFVGKPAIAVFVGGAGVGKTTTIAKLAAMYSRKHKRNVALITLDNYGITGIKTLKRYAQIIGIPLEPAVNIAGLRKSIKKFQDYDLILVDTPGINHHNRNLIREFGAFFSKLSDLQIHLVMTATTKEKDLTGTVAAFKELNINRVLITKIDESSTYGNLINLLIKTNIQLSYICSGRRVPNDIEPGSVEKIINLLVESNDSNIGRTPTVSFNPESQAAGLNDLPSIETYFVANQNSDIYHCCDCKWTKKIKPNNIIRFSSAKDANAKNYMPCSNCNPDRLMDMRYNIQTTDKVQLSKY